MKIVSRALLLTLLTPLLAIPAWADFQEGADAYNRGDYQTAMNDWLPLANSGSPEAQNAIGALYDNGLGVMADTAEAFRWYSMAANQNFPMAMRNLGTMYATGRGVPYSLPQAQLWLGRAAAAGDQMAAQRLAALPPAATPNAEPVKTPLSADSTSVAPTTQASSDFGRNNSSANLISALDAKKAIPAAAAPAAPQATAPAPQPAAPQPAAAPAPAPAAAAPATEQPGALTFPRPEPSATTASAAAPAPVQQTSVQQASVAPAPQPQGGNWLLGRWEGPSLGCPPGGGMEFLSGESRSYYQGDIAVRLPATYQVKGDQIIVSNPGIDGSYTYKQTDSNGFVITAAPPTMPASIIGAKYKRCGAAPTAAAAASTNVAAAAPAPAPVKPAAAPAAGTQKTAAASSGWDAFEKGDYQGALAIWKPQADKGDRNLQVLVGSMYDYGQGVTADKKEALKWYLKAAQLGSGRGQYAAGSLLARGETGSRNLVEAYKWLTLASRSLESQIGQVTPAQALQLRDEVARQMSQADISKAQGLVDTFRSQG